MERKFVVIEGGDGAGKATQAELLKANLEEQGQPVTTFDFPQYEGNVFGRLIGEALAGKHGNFVELSPYLAAAPYMLDRVTVRDELTQAAASGWVISNRYVESNIGFQLGKLYGDQEAMDRFEAFEYEAEYETLRLPRPDVVIYLDVTPERGRANVGTKDQRGHLDEANVDQHEADQDFQARVAEVYRQLCAKNPDWHLVNCMEGEQMRSREEIHSAILEIVTGAKRVR